MLLVRLIVELVQENRSELSGLLFHVIRRSIVVVVAKLLSFLVTLLMMLLVL